jgi:hypothetical protein
MSYALMNGKVHHMSFIQSQSEKIRKIYLAYLGIHKPADPGIKNIKIPAPDKYNRSDDLDTFMNFMRAICRYLSLYGYGGPDHEAQRVIMLGTLLKGQAEFWYNQNIDILAGKYELDIILIELFKRFVHTATAGAAWTRYKSVKY